MLNQISIMGRMVRDPELRKTASGVSCVNFTLAVDRDFSGKDGSEKETDFIDCVAWRNTADFIARYFSKGRMAIVAGRLQVRKWQNKEGENRYSTEVVADNVYFGDSKRDENPGNSFAPPADRLDAPLPNDFTAADFAALGADDSDLPF